VLSLHPAHSFHSERQDDARDDGLALESRTWQLHLQNTSSLLYGTTSLEIAVPHAGLEIILMKSSLRLCEMWSSRNPQTPGFPLKTSLDSHHYVVRDYRGPHAASLCANPAFMRDNDDDDLTGTGFLFSQNFRPITE
jgi:hypothetical protein